jgi:hypothetical protein
VILVHALSTHPCTTVTEPSARFLDGALFTHFHTTHLAHAVVTETTLPNVDLVTVCTFADVYYIFDLFAQLMIYLGYIVMSLFFNCERA